ncbi:hypothetical protein LUZ63_012950 [Rhynchospora breviuscula]|uniref:F-box domain-containing protein n=1 Tax=Rhynchospora breviuscula TaxID=2022672 RepID=A0A9Q0C7N4_9POAL|nr:hypothetical protein LUZ63_012950 [Rhynchospora breviuscula]
MMVCSPTDGERIDHLSNLPDDLLITILSFLPTHIAARTSVLCRRFRHLWKASPSLQFITQDLPAPRDVNFIAMADRSLLHRNASHQLISLRLDNLFPLLPPSILDSYMPSLLTKAHSLGLRHLTVESGLHNNLALLTIFSIDSLQSLSLPMVHSGHKFPSGISLPCLRSLSLTICDNEFVPTFNRLLSALCSLQDLHLVTRRIEDLSLSSLTIRKLTLMIGTYIGSLHNLVMFLPSLESLYFTNWKFLGVHIDVYVPLVKRAVISLDGVMTTSVSAVTRLLSSISHVEELSLHIKEHQVEFYPFSVLLEPGEDMLNFPTLKRLDVSLCFHKHNIGAIIMILHNCPALESVKLVHQFTDVARRKRKDWRSKLPSISNGNHFSAYFRDLHFKKNRKEFMKFLNRKEFRHKRS